MSNGQLAERFLLTCDITGDLRCTDDHPGIISNRRDGERDVDQRTILAPATSFVMFDPLALLKAGQNLRFFFRAIRGKQQSNRLADHLLGRISEYSFRTAVPAHYDAVKVLANNGVIRRIDDRREQ